MSVAEYKIEELEYRLQQERIARLKSENELEALKRATLEREIANTRTGYATAVTTSQGQQKTVE